MTSPSTAWTALEPREERRGPDWAVWTATLRAGLCCTRLQGRADMVTVKHIIQRNDAACRLSAKLDVLHDWSSMQANPRWTGSPHANADRARFDAVARTLMAANAR